METSIDTQSLEHACCLVQSGASAQAIPVLETLAAGEPSIALYRYHLAIARRNIGALDAARSDLLAATAMAPDNAEYHFQLALTEEALEDFDSAMRRINEAIRLLPDDPGFRYQRSLYHERNGAFGPAIDDCRFAATASGRDGWLARLGRLLAANGDTTGALAAYRSALEVDPDNPHCLSAIAGLLQPAGVPPAVETTAGLFYKAFEAQRAAGDTEGATASLEQAVALEPANARFHHHLGNCLHDLRRVDEAVVHHRAAARHDPTEPAYQRQLAAALHAAGHTTEAIATATATLDQWPDRTDVASLLGHLRFAEADYAGAAVAYGQAMRHAQVATVDHAIDFAMSSAVSGAPEAAAAAIASVQDATAGAVRFLIAFADHKLLANANQAWIEIEPGAVRATFHPLLRAADPHGLTLVLARFFETCPLFFHLAAQGAAPIQARLNLGDIGGAEAWDMSFCAAGGQGLLIPDHVFIRTDAFAAFKARIDADWKPWEDRAPLAFWRGTTTGLWQGKALSDSGKPLLGNLPRLKLAQISQAHPDIIDARVSIILQIDDADIREAIVRHGLKADYVEAVRFIDYQVQIDIDGNSNSWAGFFQKLLTGSPVVKIQSPGRFEQWFYDRLTPWENIVPAHADMSDLADKVRFLLDRPQLAMKIGAAGRKLAQDMTLQTEFARIVQRCERFGSAG